METILTPAVQSIEAIAGRYEEIRTTRTPEADLLRKILTRRLKTVIRERPVNCGGIRYWVEHDELMRFKAPTVQRQVHTKRADKRVYRIADDWRNVSHD
jgi:hypothetical protein